MVGRRLENRKLQLTKMWEGIAKTVIGDKEGGEKRVDRFDGKKS